MHAVALDIGGTKISGMLVDDKYKVLLKKRIPSPVSEPRKKALEIISSFISSLMVKNVSGIGISFPEMIYPDGTIGESAKVRGLRGLNLKAYLEKRFSCPCFVENDADCLALGENAFGAAKGKKNMIGVILGTGVGGGIVLGGRLYTSTFGSAAEFGHNIIDPSGPKERTGLKGTIEALCSGPAIISAYKNAGGKLKDPNATDIYRSKEKAAKEAMDGFFNNIGVALASLVNIFTPEVIVLGGGVSNVPFYREVNSAVKRYCYPPYRKHVKIVKNRLGDDAGIYGAAALVFNKK